MQRRVLLILLVLAMVLPVQVHAMPPGQGMIGQEPHIIAGTFETTNPIWPTLGADTRIALYDVSGYVRLDYDFISPPAAQVLGRIKGDIVKGRYRIDLPVEPQGEWLDFDGDETTPPAVQVFAAATFINFLGDAYINRGETPLNLSARLDTRTQEILGGYVVVWAAAGGEQFPRGRGADGHIFTADDPLMPLPAGWSVVWLDYEPFTVIREESVSFPIIESAGQLYDYSRLSYTDAWEALYARLRLTYPFTAEKDLDWDQIYETITPLVAQAESDMDFHLIMTQLGSLIPDSHLSFTSTPVVSQYLLGGVGISQITVTDDEQLVINTVVPGLPADEAGIQAGDVLLAVDGVPALQSLDETPLLLTSASTVHGRRFFQAALMLLGPVQSDIKLTWLPASGGDEQTATLTRKPDVSWLFAMFGMTDLDDDVISARMLDSGLGYIKVRGFAEDVSQVHALFGEELAGLVDAGAQGIILDLRYNGGGMVQLAMAMAGYFFPDYARLLDFYYADDAGEFGYRGFIEVLRSEPQYDGPVAVLVNEMTGSASDLFVYAMQQDDRALVVGYTPTGGFTGEIGDGQYRMPGGLDMQVPTGRPVDPVTGEVLLEGTGVIPDVRVPLLVESVRSEEDEVLLAAEDALLAGLE